MSENLSTFLVDLASDPDRLARFVENPSAELDHSSLTVEERAVVLTRDGRKVRDALGFSYGFNTFQQVGSKKRPKKRGGKKKPVSKKKRPRKK